MRTKKKTPFYYKPVLLIAVMVMGSLATWAQTSSSDPAETQARQLTGLMKAGLNLTSEQFAKVFEVNLRAIKKMETTLTEKPGNMQVMIDKCIEIITDELDISLLGILDGEQWNTWITFSQQVTEQVKSNVVQRYKAL